MNKPPPKISIIIPCFNSEQYIEECLKPILTLKYLEIEIIIVNDGSTDNTVEICKKICDKRIKIINKKNSGLPAARNTGIQESTGKYIISIDSDDIPVTQCWKKMIATLERDENITLCYGRFIKFFNYLPKNEPKIRLKRKRPSGNIISELVKRNIFGSGMAIIRKSRFSNAGMFNEHLTIGEDWEMWTRLALTGDFLYFDDIMLYYRQHNSSMTVDLMRYIKGQQLVSNTILNNKKIKEKLGNNFDKIKRKHEYYCLEMQCRTFLRTKKYQAATKIFLQSIKKSPPDSALFLLLLTANFFLKRNT
jgi:glycosyltransferase involved in cell wall biosynthesis